MMVVTAKPEKMAPYFFTDCFNENVKIIRATCWMTVPKKKAKRIDRNMPEIIVTALEKFRISLNGVELKSMPFDIDASIPPANAAPSNSNTSDTVVDVGKPKLL